MHLGRTPETEQKVMMGEGKEMERREIRAVSMSMVNGEVRGMENLVPSR